MRNAIELACEKLGLNINRVTFGSEFVKDLCADSLDQVEIIMGLEDEFNIEIGAEEAVKVVTVRDMCDLLLKKGVEPQYLVLPDGVPAEYPKAQMEPPVFVQAWDEVADHVHLTAKAKGWWDKPREDGTCIALIHSELSEALEALRHGNGPSDHIPEFSGAEEEYADVVIRIMDHAKKNGWKIGGAIAAKIAFNEGRTRMHGGKAF